MKLKLCLNVLPIAALLAQTATAQPAAPAAAGDYVVIEQGPHQKVWGRPVAVTTKGGVMTTYTNTYCELQTGLSFSNAVTGRWEDSSPDFQITQDGYAVATACQHQVIVAPNLNDPDGMTDLALPGGAGRLRSSILGLVLFDPVSGKSLQIADTTNCVGQQTAPNAVTFADAFTGLKADVRFRNERGKFHQEVLLREKLTRDQVARLGFDPNTVRLECWTEFFAPPAPAIESEVVGGGTSTAMPAGAAAAPAAVDEFPDWGTMRIGRGVVFVEGQDGGSGLGSAGVLKQWQQIGTRSFLIEAVTFTNLEPLLAPLPAAGTAALTPRRPQSRALAQRSADPSSVAALRSADIPVRHSNVKEAFRLSQVDKSGLPEASNTPGLHSALADKNVRAPFRVAKLAAAPKAEGPRAVWDYVLLNGTSSSLTLTGGMTFFVTGPVLTGTLTVEGTAVVKYTNSASATISATNVVCKTAPFVPVWFTSKDLNGLGETISSSTGNPATNYAAGIALDLGTYGSGIVLSNFHFSYLASGVHGYGLTFRDCQIVDCNTALSAGLGDGGPSSPTFYNLLLYNINTVVAAGDDFPGDNVTAVNVTAHNCTNFIADPTSIAHYTNCLFAAVGGWNRHLTYTNSSAFLTSDVGVFQTAGDASHYLADNSPYRNAGTTNVNATLLADLRQKTTSPPIILSNVLLSAATTLAPQAQRDTAAGCIGYHYESLDYACKWLWVSNAILTVLPGTALATFGSYGIALWSGSQLICQGEPNNLNHIARYNLVQECSTGAWAGQGNSVNGNWLGGLPVQAIFLFTDWAMPAWDGEHFQAAWNCTNLCAFSSCQFHGGHLDLEDPNPTLTNCLFERVNVGLYDTFAPIAPQVRNCLFRGGSFWVEQDNGGTWTFRDNLFDQVAVVLGGDNVDAAYSGYTPGTPFLMPTNANDVVAGIAYQTGALGSYYQPTSSAFLNKGSTTANQVGLYQYTVLTNQVKEATNRVSLGYHYVALDANGNPVDTNGDGLPDYASDTNGNGLVDSGEIGWNVTGDLGLKVLITRPKNNSVVP